MQTKDTIVRNERGYHQRASRWFPENTEIAVGERLTMGDGSVWFHPYNGRGPWQEEPAR